MQLDLKKLIDNCEIVSFDIFDTLITRLVDRPEVVFEIMEKEFAIPNFSNIRQEMQAKVGLELMQTKKYPHANMDEIYDYIKNQTDINNTDELKQFEIDLENKLLVQNPQIYEVFEYALKKKKRIIATSDMYLDLKTVKKYLDNNGYQKIDKIYLSSETRKAKFNSELFDYVIESEKVDASKIVHIGDNVNHDYEFALKKGIQSYHYKNTIINDKSTNIVQSFHKGICRYISLKNENFWINFGANGGLLYFGLYQRLLDQMDKKIYFLARDGFNMYHIFKNYHPEIDNEYIYTSRRALLLPGITELNQESLNNLPPFTFGQTVKEILEYISMQEIFKLDDLKQAGFVDYTDTIDTLDDFAKMKKLYQIKEKDVLKVCENERNNAKKYFQKLGILEEKNLIFDCGWNGSSQFLLEQVIQLFSDNTEINFFYAGIFDNEKSKRQLKNRSHLAYLFDIGDNQNLAKKLNDSIVILELYFGANHNSVLKYNKNGYVLDNLENEFAYKDDILDGLLKYFEIALPLFKEMSLNISREDAIAPILSMIENPSEEQAIIIGDIPNVDGFAAKKGIIKFIAKATMDDLNQNENHEIYWKQGLLARPDINKEVKEFVIKKYGLEKIETNKENENRYLKAIKNHGLKGSLRIIKNKLIEKATIDPYSKWIKEFEKNINKTEKLKYNPIISVIVPVYNVIEEQLIECIESVRNQNYSNWELCLVDDCSTLPETIAVLKKYENIDERIKIEYHKENGHISKTTNDGIKMATGEFIALLDCDDILSINALYEMVKKLNENKELDFIYSDEDKLTEDGKKRHNPFFKPDWSPDTFMSLMYTCHFSLFRKTIVDKIGGFTVGLDGAQDYDFVLRFTEETNKIGHISKILYHWRERKESIASNPEAKPYALNAIVQLKKNALKRRKQQGEIIYEPSVFQYRVVYKAKSKSVTLVYHLTDINNLIYFDSIENTTIAQKIIITSKKISKLINKTNQYTIIEADSLKQGLTQVLKIIQTDLIFYLNDSLKLRNQKEIAILAGHANINHAGIIGAKILYENTDIIYSVGITSQMGYHILKGQNDNIPHYYCKNKLDYNCEAVNESLFMIKKQLLEQVISKIDFSDFALSLGNKLLSMGLFNTIRNDVVAYTNKSSYQHPKRVFELKSDAFINKNVNGIDFSLKQNFDYVPTIMNDKLEQKTLNIQYELGIKKEINKLIFKGYSFSNHLFHNNENIINIWLVNEKHQIKIKTKKIKNAIPTVIFRSNLNQICFTAEINFNELKNDSYNIYLEIINKKENEKGFTDTKKVINI